MDVRLSEVARPAVVLRTLRRYDLVVVVSLLWFMVQFLRFVFPPLFETFQATYGVSNTETGILFTALLLAYAAMQFPAGVLGDRLGEPRLIVGGAVVASTAAVLVAVSPTYSLIVAGAVLIGLGTGVHKTVAIPLLSRRYADRTGLALGVMDSIGQFGGMTAPLVVVAALGVLFWQSVFLLGAAVTLGLCWLFFLRVKRDPVLRTDGTEAAGEDAPHRDDRTDRADDDGVAGGAGDGTDGAAGTAGLGSYLTVFRDRTLLVFILVTMAFTFSWNGLSAFFPLYLTTEKGLSSGVAGTLYSVLFVASVSQTATGSISDRLDRLTVGLGLFCTMLVAIGLLIVLEGLVPLLAATAVAGVGFHGFRPVRDSYLMDVIPEEMGAGTLGIVRTFMTGIGSLAPAIVGALTDTVGFVPAFGVIGAILVVGAALMLVLR